MQKQLDAMCRGGSCDNPSTDQVRTATELGSLWARRVVEKCRAWPSIGSCSKLNELAKALEAELSASVINVVGGAGRGKTRLIEESLSRTDRATRKIVRAVIDPDRPELALKKVLCDLRNFINETSSERGGESEAPTARQLFELLKKLDHQIYSIVILLEDLHHASDAICSLIRDFLRIDRSERCPLTIINSRKSPFGVWSGVLYPIVFRQLSRMAGWTLPPESQPETWFSKAAPDVSKA